ncbi:MAG: patatin-like phospholipase family protein [Dehalococcoidia bacterium]
MSDTPVPSGSASRPALVLGGGGALGVVQAAYVEAAFEMGFRPKVVVGTSVGSMNGAWIALHPDRPDELLKIWLGLDQLSLVKFAPAKIASRILHPLSVTTNDVVPQLVERFLGRGNVEDAELELAIVSTNLTRGHKHVFRTGPLGRAILASTAIPGVFEPVEIDGNQYVDGCVTASVDLTTAIEMGATEILAIDLTPPPVQARPKTAAGVLKQSFSIMSAATTREVEAVLMQQLPMRVIRPDLSKNSPWRLDDSAGSIARNLRLAREALHGVFDEHGHVAPEGTCWMPVGAAGMPEADAPTGLSKYFRSTRLKAS